MNLGIVICGAIILLALIIAFIVSLIKKKEYVYVILLLVLIVSSLGYSAYFIDGLKCFHKEIEVYSYDIGSVNFILGKEGRNYLVYTKVEEGYFSLMKIDSYKTSIEMSNEQKVIFDKRQRNKEKITLYIPEGYIIKSLTTGD